MKFNEDWSLAYLLYYLSQISYWLIAALLIMQTFNFISSSLSDSNNVVITDLPLVLHEKAPVTSNIQGQDQFKILPGSSSRTNALISIPKDNNTGLILYYFFLDKLPNLMQILFLIFFARLMKNVAQGDPFKPKNYHLLYILGWILVGYSLLTLILSFLPAPGITGVELSNGATVTSIFSMSDYLGQGIFLIVLGYVFNEGTRIYEEQKLTV